MEARNNFAVFILTHGRPDRVITYDTLRKQGYTGEIYIIIDNEDTSVGEYKKAYGDNVIVFDKEDIERRFDTGDNFQDRRAIFFARNACFEIANKIGVTYFLQLDDDYTSFVYRFSPSLIFQEVRVLNLDRLFGYVLEYYKSIGAKTIAIGQGGDFLGGGNGKNAKNLSLGRKAMNTFFCSTERPFSFVGRVNEDVNTYTSLGNRGELILTIFNVMVHQLKTQSNAGGMTDLYLDSGTYIKSFYPVMYCPSFVKISEMGQVHRRIHHHIDWDNAVPQIIEERHRIL
jgi:hypothetical protein